MDLENDTAVTERELAITRVFDAPRELVFRAWTEPEHLSRWSGPEGFTARHDYFDPRPGGRYRACLEAADGTEHWVRGVFREVDPPSRLVFTHAWEEEGGRPGPETVITVTLEDRSGRTLMAFHQAVFPTKSARDGHRGGWSSSFDRLERHLGALPGA
jgi:uncharacterized protein YndB with AHSA1/START domain